VWEALPGTYVLTSIAIQVIGAHRPYLYDKVIVFKEV
jgi:hypothetical protein